MQSFNDVKKKAGCKIRLKVGMSKSTKSKLEVILQIATKGILLLVNLKKLLDMFK
jgi:hypothetical protein